MTAEPLHYSPIPLRSLLKGPRYGVLGAGMLGFKPMPVQRQMWRLLEARTPLGMPLHEEQAIEVPRRAGKTEGLFSEGVGRCSKIEDYQITYCAQSGTKSRERFYGLLRRLSRFNPDGGWRARESRGEERIEWQNGSILRFLPPLAASFRGDAIDWLILDEGQETNEEDANELMGAVQPVFDTREAPQLTVAGTAGAVRSGLLWNSLEKGRKGLWGILEYAAPPLTPDIDLIAYISDPKLWLTIHPGPAGVSEARALEVLLKRHANMTPEMFAREYLGIWPDVASTEAFSEEVWQKCGSEHVEMPSRFGLAFDVTPDGSRTSVCAVWMDNDGNYRGEVIRDEAGTKWAAQFIVDLATKYKVPIGYDAQGVFTLTVADEIVRLSKRVQTRGLTTREFATSCATFAASVLNATFRHPRQAVLNDAIKVASKRMILDGGWAWGRKTSTGSISSLVAMTVAMRMWDDLPAAPVRKIMTANVA